MMENISTTTGGAYIPPWKLKLMQERITDKSSEAYQKLAWDALKKTINGLINKLNVDNFELIIKKLLSENVIRGRGILARTIIIAQSESPALTHVHAALVAVINSKFPQIGILIVNRLLNDFQKSYKRNDKKRCLTCSRFFAHLVNQDVINYVIIMELLYLLLDKTSNNSVEIAVGIMKEVGLKLEETSKAVCMALFDKFRHLLNEGTLDKRVNYMIEVLFQIRKDKYKDYPIVKEGLQLVDSEDQTTHVVDLLAEGAISDELNVFQLDPDFLENERKYEEMKEQILPESEEEDDEENEENEEGPVTTVDIQDQSFLSTVELRKKIYLKIHSALTHMDAAHLLLQIPLKPEQLYEMASMILDCCAQLRIYDNKFGYLAQQMCQVNHKYVEEFEKLFCENYSGIHRLDMTKIRNLAMFFAHLICTDTVSWGILVVVKITEKDTTSSGRIFLKHMFQELRSTLGLDNIIARFREEEMQIYFENIFPKDDLKDTKFAINFFTAIDLGKVTVDMRKFFDEAKTAKLEEGGDKKKSKKNANKDNDTSSDSSSESDSDSTSSSASDNLRRKSKNTDKHSKSKENRALDINPENYDDRRGDRNTNNFENRREGRSTINIESRRENRYTKNYEDRSTKNLEERREDRSTKNYEDRRKDRSTKNLEDRREDRSTKNLEDRREDRSTKHYEDRREDRSTKNLEDRSGYSNKTIQDKRIDTRRTVDDANYSDRRARKSEGSSDDQIRRNAEITKRSDLKDTEASRGGDRQRTQMDSHKGKDNTRNESDGNIKLIEGRGIDKDRGSNIPGDLKNTKDIDDIANQSDYRQSKPREKSRDDRRSKRNDDRDNDPKTKKGHSDGSTIRSNKNIESVAIENRKDNSTILTKSERSSSDTGALKGGQNREMVAEALTEEKAMPDSIEEMLKASRTAQRDDRSSSGDSSGSSSTSSSSVGSHSKKSATTKDSKTKITKGANDEIERMRKRKSSFVSSASSDSHSSKDNDRRRKSAAKKSRK